MPSVASAVQTTNCSIPVEFSDQVGTWLATLICGKMDQYVLPTELLARHVQRLPSTDGIYRVHVFEEQDRSISACVSCYLLAEETFVALCNDLLIRTYVWTVERELVH